eukprot:6021832-Amphidinium_carterae.1
MALVRVMSGEEGLRRVRQEILNILPSEGQQKTVECALDDIKALQRKQLFQYAGSQAKGDVAATLETLTEIDCKIMPARIASPSAFMLSVWAKLPYFAVVELPVDGAEDASEKTVLMGQKAVNHMWQAIEATAEPELSQQDVDALGVWAWLLTNEQQEKLHALSMRVLNSKQATPAKRQLHAREQKTSKKSKVQKAEPENQAALAFLGVK